MAKEITGIEIGNGQIAMYQNGNPSRLIVSRLPENLIKDNEIVSPEALSQVIRSLKSEGKFSGKNCALILPGEATFFRSVNMPPVTEQQLKLNLPYEFRDFVGVESINYNYDYLIEGYDYDEEGKVTGLRMLAAAASKEVIARYEAVLKRAGFKLTTALPREMGIINLLKNSVRHGADAEKDYCLVEIGYDTTGVYILKGGTLRASKIIEMGNKDMDEAIAEHYNIDVYLAASYRESNRDGILDSELMEDIYDRISLEIMKAINFYRYENQESDISECHFGGSGADNMGIVRSILEYTQLKKGDMDVILPAGIKGQAGNFKALTAIGATL